MNLIPGAGSFLIFHESGPGAGFTRRILSAHSRLSKYVTFTENDFAVSKSVPSSVFGYCRVFGLAADKPPQTPLSTPGRSNGQTERENPLEKELIEKTQIKENIYRVNDLVECEASNKNEQSLDQISQQHDSMLPRSLYPTNTRIMASFAGTRKKRGSNAATERLLRHRRPSNHASAAGKVAKPNDMSLKPV